MIRDGQAYDWARDIQFPNDDAEQTVTRGGLVWCCKPPRRDRIRRTDGRRRGRSAPWGGFDCSLAVRHSTGAGGDAWAVREIGWRRHQTWESPYSKSSDGGSCAAGPCGQPDRMAAGGDNTLLTSREAAAYLGIPYRKFMRSYKKWGIAVLRPDPAGACLFRVRTLNHWLDHNEKLL